MQNSYLIPANTKKSQLIFGWFTPIDLGIVVSGGIATLLMLILISSPSLPILILIFMPLVIGTFLVMPVPHYHNVLQLLTNIFNFFLNRRRYYWRGWNIYEYEEFTTSRK